MKPLFEIFDAENEKLLASQEIKKNLHKIDASDASVVVQLSSGDVKGNNFRALRPGDTELVVGVYSVNEKGNLAVLTGLGKEPVAVISTIFDIVKNCVTKNKTIETIVFRLNKRALKGKEKLLQRIIQKLLKARFGSRFEIKDEFIDVSPAMSFIVAQKRNADELDPEDFVERQEKVKDQMVVKQLAIDFDKPEGDAIESELTSYKGATISYGENYTIINFNKNYNSEIFQDAIGKLKAKNPSLSFRHDQNSLTVGARLSREQTIEVCEAVFESDKENFNRLLNLKSKPNFDLGNDQPNKKQNIKLARKLALDEIKSYADANKFKKATLSKYKYIDIIGSHSTHSNNQVLIGITLDSGTTIPEYRDEEKCSGWIATDNRKIDSNTVTDVATDIKYRLQQEGFNVSMTSKNWYRYLESDDFVIVVALDFPKKSDRFETSGNTYVNMISAYLYNKLTNKVHLLSDSAGVASVDSQDINKTIVDLVKTKTVNVDKLPAEDFIAKELEPKVDLKSNLEKTLKLAKNYDFSADSNDSKFIDRLAKLTDIKEVSKEIEYYLKVNGDKPNASLFIENVLEQFLLAFPQKDTLPNDDKEIVRKYTSTQTGINRALRSGEELSPNQQKFVDDLSKTVVKNSREFEILYRVMPNMDPKLVEQWLNVSKIKDDAFVSASLAPAQFLSNYRVENSAEKQKGSFFSAYNEAFANNNQFDVILRIKNAKGALVGDASVHAKEAEVLIDKGAEFKILNMDKIIVGKSKNVIELTVYHTNGQVAKTDDTTNVNGEPLTDDEILSIIRTNKAKKYDVNGYILKYVETKTKIVFGTEFDKLRHALRNQGVGKPFEPGRSAGRIKTDYLVAPISQKSIVLEEFAKLAQANPNFDAELKKLVKSVDLNKGDEIHVTTKKGYKAIITKFDSQSGNIKWPEIVNNVDKARGAIWVENSTLSFTKNEKLLSTDLIAPVKSPFITRIKSYITAADKALSYLEQHVGLRAGSTTIDAQENLRTMVKSVNKVRKDGDKTTYFVKTNRGLDASITYSGNSIDVTWPEIFDINAYDIVSEIKDSKALGLKSIARGPLKAKLENSPNKLNGVLEAVDKVGYIHASNMVNNNLYGDFDKSDIDVLKQYGKFRLSKGKKNLGKFIINDDDTDITVEHDKTIGTVLNINNIEEPVLNKLKNAVDLDSHSKNFNGTFDAAISDFSSSTVSNLVAALRQDELNSTANLLSELKGVLNSQAVNKHGDIEATSKKGLKVIISKYGTKYVVISWPSISYDSRLIDKLYEIDDTLVFDKSKTLKSGAVYADSETIKKYIDAVDRCKFIDNDGKELVSESKPKSLFDIAKTILEQNARGR